MTKLRKLTALGAALATTSLVATASFDGEFIHPAPWSSDDDSPTEDTDTYASGEEIPARSPIMNEVVIPLP